MSAVLDTLLELFDDNNDVRGIIELMKKQELSDSSKHLQRSAAEEQQDDLPEIVTIHGHNLSSMDDGFEFSTDTRSQMQHRMLQPAAHKETTLH